MFGKIPGDDWQKGATLRALFGFMYAHPGKKLMFMGSEFGQGREWNHDHSLDWHLLDKPLHAGIRRFVQDLNRIYRDEPALHEVDFEGTGFSWIDCNDSENSVVSLIRRAKDGRAPVIAVLNFTPVQRDGYRIGVPQPGAYTELLNSDAEIYGGCNVGNGGVVTTEPITAHGYPQSLRLTLPALSCLLLKPAAELTAGRPSRRPVIRAYVCSSPSIRSHCSSVTGITDSRDMRTSAKSAKAVSALISASRTGRLSLRTGVTSTPYSFPLASAGSGEAFAAAFITPTTAFSSPV